MVIHNFYVERIFALPAEANSPLVIHANAVLAFAVVFQGFQMVAVRHAQIVQTPRLMQQQQFPPGNEMTLAGGCGCTAARRANCSGVGFNA